MPAELILGAAESAIKKRNDRIAEILSLIPNSPDARGRDMFEQEEDRLERVRSDWQNKESPAKLGEEVLISSGIPIGIAPMGGYITTEPITGILNRTHSLRGGSGYMEHGHRVRDALAHVTVTLPLEEGQTIPQAVVLLVPNDMFKAVSQNLTVAA